MPPQTATRTRSLPPTLRASGVGRRAVQRPTDLNEPGFLDRFVSDIGTILTNFPRALVNIAGAPVSDLYALAPGGREAGTAGQATAGLIGDIGKSLWDTGQRIDDLGGVAVAPGTLAAGLLGGERFTRHLDEEGREAVEQYREHPGLMAVEDIGNVALGGAAASKVAGTAARAAAGQGGVGRTAARAAREAAREAGRGRFGQTIAGRGARRSANRAAIEEIAASGGRGSRLAETAKFTEDILSRPYRATGRALADIRLPGRHSLREVGQQVRASAPIDRMTVTPEMKDAATLRSMRAKVEDLSERAWRAQEEGLPDADTLWEDWFTESKRLQQFEDGLGGRLEQIEQARLAPTPLDELSSPLARDVRSVLDTEGVQRLTKPFVRMRRETKAMVQDLRREKGDESLEILVKRDPSSRRKQAIRDLRDVGNEVDLARYGIDELPAFGRVDDAALLDTLVKVAENPELRELLPNLDSTLDLTILDLAEGTQGLPSGALRDQLYDDAVLTPEVAEVVRALQREGTGAADDMVTLYRGTSEPLDLDRIGDEGIRFTDDPDYALSNTNEGTHPYLYEVQVPRDRLTVGTSQFADLLGDDAGPGGAVLTADEVALGYRQIDPSDAGRRTPEGVLDQLPDDVRAVTEEALGRAYRIPDEQLQNPLANQSETVRAAYNRALRRLTEEAADRDVQLAELGLGDPERWALRVVNEDGRLRAMTPGESPSLQASPSARQARKLRRLGVQTARARRRLEEAVEASERRGDAGKAQGYERYRAALREQKRTARAWDRARRAGDEELAARLRKELDAKREKARRARVDARKDVFTASQGAARALEAVVRAMQSSEVPVGGAAQIASDIEGIRTQLDTLFAEADVSPSARLTEALAVLDEAGIDVAAADANTLDNLNLTGQIDPEVDSQWRDAVGDSRDAVKGSKAARLNVRNVENLLRAEERARVAAQEVRRLERRLDNAEGRLTDLDPDVVDKARVRAADAADEVNRVAEELGLSTRGGQVVVGDRLLREQVKARLRQRELRRIERGFERAENAFAQAEADMLQSIKAAPAVARPILQVGRALQDVDAALRDAGLDQLADDLALEQLPQTLDDLEAAGVSPTFLRRIEERAAAVGYRAGAERPVRDRTMRSQRRREMADIDVVRDIDRVKAQTDIELASKVLNGQMIETFLDKFGRTPDQIAESLIESGILNRDAWRDMTKGQRERLLQEQGFNAYVPNQEYAFKVRRTGDADRWIPQHLNDGLTEYLKPGPIETFLTNVLNPATTTWKHFILALRPAWHVYNVVGNAVMAGAGGGANVAEYLDFMRPGGEARTMLRRHRLGWDLEEFGLKPDQADELLGGGVSRDLAPEQRTRARASDALREPESIKRLLDTRFARRAGGPANTARRGFNSVVGASYRANAYMDHLNRASLFLYETTRRGTDVETALQRVNKVLGDYQTMTPTERIYIRSIFPFYAWMRHITGLTTDMLKPDNITRTAILGTVTNTLGAAEGEEALLPDYMAGDIQIGNTGAFLGMRGFNPWQDVLDVVLYNEQVSTRGALRSMHPLAQFAQERNTGLDTLTGRPFSRPVPVLDDLGREIPTPPPMLEHLFGNFAPPQAQLLRRIGRSAIGETNARYSTGDPVLVEGVSEPSALAGIGSFFGAPVRIPELEGVEERRGRAMDRVSRQIARYREEIEAYEQERSDRSWGERLIPFGN